MVIPISTLNGNEILPQTLSHNHLSSNADKPAESLEKFNDLDANLMRRMGYKQELKRGLSGLMSFTFCFTVVSVFPSVSIGLDFGLNTGGSGVIIWSWIVGSIFNILVGLSLAEICSTYPTAGSVYNWTGQLCSIRYAPLASYICGWFNFFGNVGGNAAYASGFASIVHAAVRLRTNIGNDTNGLNDVPNVIALNDRIQVAVAIGVVLLWTLQNCSNIHQQGWLNNLATFLQMASIIAITITILVMAKSRTSIYDVFFSTINVTGFSFPYVCIIGILPTVFSFSGFDAAAQLSEETRDAARKAPLAIIGTCVSAVVIGFIYLISLMIAAGNPLNIVKNPFNPSVTVQIYQISTSSNIALLFTILLVICLYFAGMSATSVSSRLGYAMARDKIFPYSRYLSIVYKRTHTPLPCVLLVCVINILLLLLQLVSTTAFAAIISISNIGFQFSYMLPILFRLTSSRKTFTKGPFNLGKYSFIIGLFSLGWLFITCIILVFPFNYPITAKNFNWTLVVCAGIFLIAALYWIFWARKWFIGPHRLTFIEIPPSPNIIVTRF